MYAVIGGDEFHVDPTSEWLRTTLKEIEAFKEGLRFVALIRDTEDQMNVQREDDGFIFEWYLSRLGGPQVAYRQGLGGLHKPQGRKGFFASIFSKSETIGSRFHFEDAVKLLEAYVKGTNEFPGLEWKPLYR